MLKRIAVASFRLLFFASVFGSWAWFITDLGRSEVRHQQSDVRNQKPELTSDLRPLIPGTDLRPLTSDDQRSTLDTRPSALDSRHRTSHRFPSKLAHQRQSESSLGVAREDCAVASPRLVS